ncbi:MAG: PspC domain-containing protein [Phocaeicola sp.]
MRKTLTVNLGGTIYHINDDAYQLLDEYLVALRAHFETHKAGDEIVNDMEFRISEIFSEHIARGVQVIDYIHVEQVIARMGKPEQMEEEVAEAESNESVDSPQVSISRKLFRDPDDKILGGVTSGIAAYLGWDATLLRLALILIGCFVHGLFLAYLIAWIVMPIAKTAADRMAMCGKTPNLENIGKTVTDGFERVNDYVRSPKGDNFWHRLGEGLVNVAGFLIKVVLIFLAICAAPILLLLFVVCFALLIASLGLFAATPDILSELNQFFPHANFSLIAPFPGSQFVVAFWSIMLVGIPIAGIVQLVMAHFKKCKPMSLVTKLVLILIWFFSLGGIFWFFFNQPFWEMFVNSTY